MAAIVTLLLGFAFLLVILVVFVSIFTTLLVAMATGMVVAFAIVVYGSSFLGIYLVLGDGYAGWSIFGAMLLGTAILKAMSTREDDSNVFTKSG